MERKEYNEWIPEKNTTLYQGYMVKRFSKAIDMKTEEEVEFGANLEIEPLQYENKELIFKVKNLEGAFRTGYRNIEILNNIEKTKLFKGEQIIKVLEA